MIDWALILTAVLTSLGTLAGYYLAKWSRRSRPKRVESNPIAEALEDQRRRRTKEHAEWDREFKGEPEPLPVSYPEISMFMEVGADGKWRLPPEVHWPPEKIAFVQQMAHTEPRVPGDPEPLYWGPADGVMGARTLAAVRELRMRGRLEQLDARIGSEWYRREMRRRG